MYIFNISFTLLVSVYYFFSARPTLYHEVYYRKITFYFCKTNRKKVWGLIVFNCEFWYHAFHYEGEPSNCNLCCLSDVMALCGNYQLLVSVPKWLIDMWQILHKCSWNWLAWHMAQSIVWIHSNLETKHTQSWVGWGYCSLHSVVLTVPDKVPFSTGTDTAHPPHRSAATVFSHTFTCMFPTYITGHWRDGSLLDWGQSPGKTGSEG